VGQVTFSSSDKEALEATEINGVWGEAAPAVFATGQQNANPSGEFESVSCSTPGNCSAVGQFVDPAGSTVPFEVTQNQGSWGQATPVPFDFGGEDLVPLAGLNSVSCPSDGNCTTVGGYTTPSLPESGEPAGLFEPFEDVETGGLWNEASENPYGPSIQDVDPTYVPTPGFTQGGYFNSVSCPSAGNCSAVGQFAPNPGIFESFEAWGSNDTWTAGDGGATIFPDQVQNGDHDTDLTSVSCSSDYNCAAVGHFLDTAGHTEAFEVVEKGEGVWGDATPTKFGPNFQSADPNTSLRSVSCPSDGNCVAVGQFSDSSGGYDAFEVVERDGVWGDAVPANFATGAQSVNSNANLNSVSCSSANNCEAIGQYTNSSGSTEPFVSSDVNGTWTSAPVTFPQGDESSSSAPSPDYTDADGDTSISCASSKYCAAVGQFEKADGQYEGFEVNITREASTPPPISGPGPGQLPATVTVLFVNQSTSLNASAKGVLSALCKKLVAGGSVVVTGYGLGDSRAATTRATVVAHYLIEKAHVRATIRSVVTIPADKATVQTTKN